MAPAMGGCKTMTIPGVCGEIGNACDQTWAAAQKSFATICEQADAPSSTATLHPACGGVESAQFTGIDTTLTEYFNASTGQLVGVVLMEDVFQPVCAGDLTASCAPAMPCAISAQDGGTD